MVRNGGKTGVALTFGFRWALSKKINELLARDIKGYRIKCPGCGKIMKFTDTATSRYCRKCQNEYMAAW